MIIKFLLVLVMAVLGVVDNGGKYQAQDPVTKSVVTRVIDGDTVELIDGRRVRYIGVDTPETVDPRKTVGCFGREASEKNKQLVLGKKVRLERDISDTDRYHRLLRYVYLDGEMVNEILVRDGYARVSTYPPDVKYTERFVEAERIARKSRLGLWGGCD